MMASWTLRKARGAKIVKAQQIAMMSFKYASTVSSRERSESRLNISGIYPPITTPFDSKGNIDYTKLRSNFDQWNKIPFAGYVVMGSNGEAVSLKKAEKLELLRNVRQMSNPKSIVIAGLGMNTSTQTTDLCNAVAEDKSADAALIITPSFYKGQMTDLSLTKYFEEVTKNSKLPIILYSVPGNTNLDLGVHVCTALAQHPNCIGLKDSGGDITKISQIVDETKESNFQVLAGSAGFLLPALLMGCVGGICALANVLGEEVCKLYRLFEDNNLPEAISLQRRLIEPNILVTRKYGVAGLKASMDEKGLFGGNCRSPLLPIEPKQLKMIKSSFAKNHFPLDG